MPPMTVLLTATTGLIGLWAGCFLEQARGFTALTVFTDMWITGLILITVTLDRCRIAGRSASTISKEMRREMGEATSAKPAMTPRVSTRSPDIGVVAMLVDMAAGGTRAQSELRDSV
jgi:hypothetical protein